jgi:hypothetical protein
MTHERVRVLAGDAAVTADSYDELVWHLRGLVQPIPG